jgi:hypothetical protein
MTPQASTTTRTTKRETTPLERAALSAAFVAGSSVVVGFLGAIATPGGWPAWRAALMSLAFGLGLGLFVAVVVFTWFEQEESLKRRPHA